MRKAIIATVGVAAAFAGPGASLASADFVCPVLGASGTNGATHLQNAADNGNKNLMVIGGGDWSTIGPDLKGVPDHATNQNGAGDPMGVHASPGDPGYTAIWNTP
jgi:hypothetical protein